MIFMIKQLLTLMAFVLLSGILLILVLLFQLILIELVEHIYKSLKKTLKKERLKEFKFRDPLKGETFAEYQRYLAFETAEYLYELLKSETDHKKVNIKEIRGDEESIKT